MTIDLNDFYQVDQYIIENGKLPEGFNNWVLSSGNGWTIAHVAAEAGILPFDFNLWELADDDGCTVAHMAASSGSLPPDFDKWDLMDDEGTTVRDNYEDYLIGSKPTTFN